MKQIKLKKKRKPPENLLSKKSKRKKTKVKVKFKTEIKPPKKEKPKVAARRKKIHEINQ